MAIRPTSDQSFASYGVFFAMLLAVSPSGMAVPVCEPGVNMPGGDLPNMPLPSPNEIDCAAKCAANEDCNLFSFLSANCTYYTDECSLDGGCCWLKTEEVSGLAPQVNLCACSAYARVPKSTESIAAMPAAEKKKNMLYILIDDLRPELEAYGQSSETHHSPNIKTLADSSMVFDNAYCQIAVCSPSRMSFLTGRRPDHSGILNFINHFRQADCGLTAGGKAYTGKTLRSVDIDGCEWGGAAPCGGSGQCCSLCTEDESCGAWTYTAANRTCQLKASKGDSVNDHGAVSGVTGTFDTHASWTTIPQHFKNNGYLALSTGKVFHTEEGGAGNANPDANGPGMPPNNDPRSWHIGLSMGKVNDVALMNNCEMGANSTCPVDATIDGFVANPNTTPQLCDRVVADDAVLKLRLASANLNATGQPFFLAVGFRKPHLSFRFPAPILDLLPPMQEVDVAAHPTLDSSVPSIAHHDDAPQASPFKSVDNATAQQWRQYYRAAIAWMDSQLGRVLRELDALGLHDDTMVVLHADHGWSLGEHGEWQKFTNFEHGTRVPLIMRVPWMVQTAGTRTSVLAELIDIFPTMMDVLDVPMIGPEASTLDGTSLLPVLLYPHNKTTSSLTKSYAWSQYPRCPRNLKELWANNDCNMNDRTQIPFIGYTIRTASYRYTEWCEWDGSKLRPDWSKALGNELYTHEGDDGFDFDSFENFNQNETHPEVRQQLSNLLRALVANQTRLW